MNEKMIMMLHGTTSLSVVTLSLQELEDGLKEKDKAWKDASNKLEQLTAELEQEKQLGNRRDKTIQGLVCSLHKKEKEVMLRVLGTQRRGCLFYFFKFFLKTLLFVCLLFFRG